MDRRSDNFFSKILHRIIRHFSVCFVISVVKKVV